jgi:glutamine---fructose-6-phosphate transaminase (isomerizing)
MPVLRVQPILCIKNKPSKRNFMMTITPFIKDILNQSEVLSHSIPQYDFSPLKTLQGEIASGKIDRIIITGMGASLYGGYAAWLTLVQHGLPAYIIDAAEILHYTPQIITPASLVWIVTQSGRSAELLPLLDIVKQSKARLITTTNNPNSPLGNASIVSMPILSPTELTVSTVTFTTTLASLQLAALALCGKPVEAARQDLLWTAQALQPYLDKWETHVSSMQQRISLNNKLFIVGRGPSLPATMTGSLIQSEAAKMAVVGLNAAEFRHGPYELGAPDLTILILAGAEKTRELNKKLCEDLLGFQSKAFWVSSQPADNLPWIEMPAWRGCGMALAEILPLQLLTIALANQKGLEAGKFFHSGKITLTE